MEINFEALVNALQDEGIVDNNPKVDNNQKVYLVTWCNGEQYGEDQETEIMGIFSTEEKAQSYANNWRDEYRKKGEWFYKYRGEEFIEEDFKCDFPEFIYVSEYNLL